MHMFSFNYRDHEITFQILKHGGEWEIDFLIKYPENNYVKNYCECNTFSSRHEAIRKSVDSALQYIK